MTVPRVLVIVPCFNEQANIVQLLQEISSHCVDMSTVVIDDGSDDATFALASQRTTTVKLLRNLGIGGAVQTGIKFAYVNRFEFCVQIDGDGQHPPEEIRKLLKAYSQEPSSIVIGSRYLNGDSFRSTWARRLGSRAIACALNRLFARSAITDPTSGMRLMDSKAIEFFARNYPHDFPEPISLAWALRRGLTVSEVPVMMRARQGGNSSIHGMKSLTYMLRVLGYVFLARFMQPPCR